MILIGQLEAERPAAGNPEFDPAPGGSDNAASRHQSSVTFARCVWIQIQSRTAGRRTTQQRRFAFPQLIAEVCIDRLVQTFRLRKTMRRSRLYQGKQHVITGPLLLGTHPRRRAMGWAMSAPGVRRAKTALSSGCKSHPATAPAGSNRSRHGGNEMAEASG